MRVLLVDVPPVLEPTLRQVWGARGDVQRLSTDLLDPAATSGAAFDVVVHALGQGQSDEEKILRSTLGVWNLLAPMRTGRYLQLSTMRVHDGYDDGWDVRERWLPRPALDAATLACHLGELTSLELTRTRQCATRVLRFDEIVDDATFSAGSPHPRWLHLDDARMAVRTVCLDESGAPGSWHPHHVVRGEGRFRLDGLTALGFTPDHPGPVSTPCAVPRSPAHPTPLHGLQRPRRVTIFGAGGPMGVVAANSLLDRGLVRMTDAVGLAALLQRPAQSPGAPVPTQLPEPHTHEIVDVTDGDQVRRAAVGADCLINVSVIRHDVAAAFRVNTLGSWHVMQAAIAVGVPKVVFTGPTLAFAPYPFAAWDRRLDGTQMFRTGDWVYMMSKLLGQELTRLLAEAHGIAVPTLLWADFVTDGQLAGADPHRPPTDFAISWRDAGRAILAAVDVAELPEPAPVINIVAPSPTGRWTTERASAILGFEPADDLSRFWWDERVQAEIAITER